MVRLTMPVHAHPVPDCPAGPHRLTSAPSPAEPRASPLADGPVRIARDTYTMCPILAVMMGLRFLIFVVALALAVPVAAQDQSGPPGTWFPVEALNTGLGPLPDDMSIRTPQGAVESFLDAIADDRPQDAAHVLDLSEIPPDAQAERGAELAAKFAVVLKRRAILSYSALLERPDALDAAQSSSAALAGEPRRSLLIGVLEKGDSEAAIRLNRIRPADGDPVWVFSRRTVSQIPALYALYGPSRFEQALPNWLVQKTILGTRVFETIGLPITLILAGFAGRITFLLFRSLARRASGYWSRTALRAIRWPSILIVTTTVVLVAALKIFTVSGTVASILTPVTLIGYVVAVMLFAMTLLDTALDRIVTFDADNLADPDNSTVRAQATLMTGARRVLMVGGIVIGTGIVLASANVFRSLGFSLLASAGAVTLIVGFAAQHILGNILASLQISLNRSARIGDQIIFEGQFCTVERIHFTYVQLKKWNANRLVVPVSYFLSDTFESWSLVDASMICSAEITLAQRADIDTLRDRFMAICKEDEFVTDSSGCTVVILSQDAFGIVARFQFPVDDPNQTWATECRVREAILTAAQALEEETENPVLPQGSLDDMDAA